MKYRHVIWPLLLAVVVLAGCSRNKLSGEWDGSKSAMGLTATVHLSLGKDGAYAISQKLQGAGRTMDIAEKGTYSVDAEAKTITFQATETTINGEKPPMPKELKVTQPYTLEDGTLTLNPGQEIQEIVFHRTK